MSPTPEPPRKFFDGATGLRWLAIAVLLAGILLMAGLTLALLALFGIISSSSGIPLQSGQELAVDVSRLALTVLAGAGGLVALVVAYRRQRYLELDTSGLRDQEKAFRERYSAAAQQLGDSHPAVRLAGIYALGNLADAWVSQRQQCVDVLCAYLRLPWVDQGPVDPQSTTTELSIGDGQSMRRVTRVYEGFFGEREVRRSLIRTISAHLRESAQISWSELAFDFSGAELRDFDVSGAQFLGGLNCQGCSFVGESPANLANCILDGEILFDAVEVGEAGLLLTDARVAGPFRMNGVKLGGRTDFSRTTFQDVCSMESLTSTDSLFMNKSRFTNPLHLTNCLLSGNNVGLTGAKFESGLSISGTIRASDVRLDEMAILGDKTTIRFVHFGGGDFSICKNDFGSVETRLESMEIQVIDLYFEANVFRNDPVVDGVTLQVNSKDGYGQLVDLIARSSLASQP